MFGGLMIICVPLMYYIMPEIAGRSLASLENIYAECSKEDFVANNVDSNDLDKSVDNAKANADCTSKCTCTANGSDLNAIAECTQGYANAAFVKEGDTFATCHVKLNTAKIALKKFLDFF